MSWSLFPIIKAIIRLLNFNYHNIDLTFLKHLVIIIFIQFLQLFNLIRNNFNLVFKKVFLSFFII